MPKRKTVDAEVVSAPKVKASAATHKRATKKPEVEAAIVPAPESARPVTDQDIAVLAYSYWEARGFEGGNPEEDWFRARRELSELAQNR